MRPAQGDAACSDSESEPDHPHDEDDEDNVIYTAKQQQQQQQLQQHGAAAFRSRILPRHPKGITTAPGQHGAGETETEADEPVSHCLLTACIEIFNGFFFHKPDQAKTFTDGTHRARFGSAGATKLARAAHHAALVRGVPTALYRSGRIWGAVQSIQCVLCAPKWKNCAH
jgi:hypothetical protein